MKIETKKIFIADDGKEFDTLEKCQEYESINIISALEYKIAELISKREIALSLKNRYKANKYGKLAQTERALLIEYKCIKKMIKVPVNKMPLQDVETLQRSFASVSRLRLQRQQQTDFYNELRYKIKERGEQIKNLYEKLVKLKAEKLNS